MLFFGDQEYDTARIWMKISDALGRMLARGGCDSWICCFPLEVAFLFRSLTYALTSTDDEQNEFLHQVWKLSASYYALHNYKTKF
jgi:hypothetical protein